MQNKMRVYTRFFTSGFSCRILFDTEPLQTEKDYKTLPFFYQTVRKTVRKFQT